MSRHGILLFLIAVYAILAGVCLLFPGEGVALGGARLDFPSLESVVSSLAPHSDEPTAPDPEALLKERMEAIRLAEHERFETYISGDPSRIEFPNDDVSLFDPLFCALDSARMRHMRILHYGDSQLEEDRISYTVRARLQERFGGGGPGLLPFGSPYYTLGFSLSSTADLGRSIVFGEGASRNDSRYGIMGRSALLDTTVFTSVNATKGNKTPSRYFRRMTMLCGSGVTVKHGTKQYKSGTPGKSGVCRIVIDLPDSSSSVRFST